MKSEIEGIARARFFSNYGIETCKVKIEANGSVLVWDRIAEHYTRCHSLRPAAEKRIARKLRTALAGRLR